jgi:hypothetical protein
MSERWMVCSACRKDIPFRGKHWVCSVSTCNRARTRLVFCSVGCWDSHVAVLRHRDAWAVEAVAPTREEWAAEEAAAPPPQQPAAPPPPAHPAAPRPQAAPPPPPARAPTTPGPAPAPARTVAAPAPAPLAEADESEILIVISKLKKYVRERSGMNCSDAVAEGLSDHVRKLCDAAIRAAIADGRKTVLDRDVPRVVK